MLLLACCAAVAALALVGLAIAGSRGEAALAGRGPADGALLGAARLRAAAFSVTGGRAALERQRWLLDGHEVTQLVDAVGGALVLRPARLPQALLPDGAHVLEVVQRRSGLLGRRAVRRFAFSTDTVAPRLRVAGRLAAARLEPLAVAGTAQGATQVLVEGRPARLRGARFDVVIPAPSADRLRIVATDAAGNRSSATSRLQRVPRQPAAPIRAVHVTAYGWADPGLRSAVLRLIDERRINAVQLDLKDEGGIVGFAAAVPFGRQIGAVQEIYDLEAAVRELHARGIRVIGRVVCFRDPVAARWAWEHGRREQVVQTPEGGPYAGYGGFTSFADPAVRDYNIAVAVAGARAGVDDILYDYVRRPDGPIASMRFPGLAGTPEGSIAGFLRASRVALAPYRTFVGASVFGVAATRPLEVAQDIPRMAREVDYIAPMVYPSHWAPGEYGVRDPNGQPYEIVHASLADFQRAVRGTGARVVPWLQDFSIGRAYGPTEVRAQIQAAADAGSREFLLWNAGATYTSAALSTDARRARPDALASAPSARPGADPPLTRRVSHSPG